MKYALRMPRRASQRMRSAPRPGAVDAAVMAYAEWRGACTAVRNAYRSWACARNVDGELAYRAYEAALDREQAAARVYAGLMREVGQLVESGLDYPLDALSPNA